MTVTDLDPTFVQDWQDWHRAKDDNLAAPHGFLAITGLHWLTADPQTFPDAPGAWSSDGTAVLLELAPGEELTVDGEPITGRHLFEPIAERGGVQAIWGDAVIEIARRGGHDIVRPRHPDNALRTEFAGTPAYEPDPAWVVAGRYVAFDEPRPTAVGAVVEGLEHVYDAPGQVEFELNGQPLALTVFPGHVEGTVNVLFTDATSGVTTYAANRSLTVPVTADGAVILDFNRAVNLPCAYTDLATCPLPPRENRLPFAVEAGEKIPRERI